MTRIEYELLRVDEPQLHLPAWYQLCENAKVKASDMNRKELIAKRTAVLLGRDYPQPAYVNELGQRLP